MPVRIVTAFLMLSLSFLAVGQQIIIVPVASGIASPVDIDNAGDGSGRLFILERSGRVLIHSGTALLAAPFLDIQQRVGCCSERGLLGIAFHPQYETNGYFFLNYTNKQFNTVIARYRVSADANRADPDSEEILLTINQPFSNHNGGQLTFGPDGYLYIGMGDGGGAGDPQNNAQNSQSLLGKMLRIDVDNGSPYGIPPDNPHIANPATRNEIWASGLRSPFRFSFDRIIGDLFIADVGQDEIEEVHLHLANTPAGENYGWRLMEGTRCFNPASNCNNGSLTLPVFEYDHSQGRCSITGGYRYRGTSIDSLFGGYIYGDFCTGEIFAATQNAGNWIQQVLLDTTLDISSFGEDEAGEMYVADLAGTVYQLVAPLEISPASGSYVSSQLIDLTLIMRKPGVTVTSLIATLNSADVTPELNACSLPGTLISGGVSIRCPGIPLSLLPPGMHTFTVTTQLSDGNSVNTSVTWKLLGNNE